MKIKFINFNGIKQYARVMYNDVKDSDKYKIEVAYNGKDIKTLLEYLFKLEKENKKQKEILDKIKEIFKDYGAKEDIVKISMYRITGEEVYTILELLEEIE